MRALVLVLLALAAAARPSFADNHALLIGIDDYQQRDRISSLSAAAADAKGLAKCLEEVSGFRPENMSVLTSDGETKPTAANIVFELSQLVKRVKPGDLVFVLFSGHGMEIDGESFLLPFETDIRADETLKRTALATSDITKLLARLPAKALIVVYDMCRSEPRKSGREAVGGANTLSARQAKTLVVTPVAGGAGPQNCVTFFACSPRQRSFEYLAKKRGYFSYFLEKGIRDAAADRDGTVRIRNLKDYLQKAVSGAVKREEGEEQTPYPEIQGPEADDLVLARGRPPGEGGATAVPAVVGSDSAAKFDAAFQRAYELLTQKRYDAAKIKFEDALEIDPKSARVHYMLAYINDYFTPNYKEAERLYRKAIELNPKDSRAMTELAGLVGITRKDYAESERLFRKAIEADPTNSQAYAGLAIQTYRVKKDLPEAEKLYLKALQHKPRSTGVREVDVKLGLPAISYARFCAESKKDLNSAEKLYREALNSDPEDVMTLASYAEFLFSFKLKFDDAEKIYEKALAISPSDSAALTGLAVLKHLARRDLNEAERLYKQAISGTIYDATPYCLYGDLLRSKQDFAGAEKMYRKAMEVDPSSAYPHASLAQMALDRGDPAQAEQFAKKAISVDPQFSLTYRVLAIVALGRAGGVDEAIGLYKQAIAANPADADAIKRLANLTHNPKGDLAGAEKLYRQALELIPNDAQSINGIANIRLDQNRLDEAETLYKKALDLTPTDSVIVGNLGALYQKRANYALAEQWYQKALTMDPKNAGNLNGYGNTLLALNRPADAERQYRSAVALAPQVGVYHANLAAALFNQNKRADALAAAQAAIRLGFKGPHFVFQRLGLNP